MHSPAWGSPGRRPRRAETRRNLWLAAGALVLVALVAHHNITSDEIMFFVVVVPSIILHEVSHGWVARAFGDPTAALAGRLTLNPVKHVDLVGTVIVPAAMALATVGAIGWAKPVPVNTARLRSPRNQGVLVALAGPATNVVLALVGAAIFVAGWRTSFNADIGLRTPSLLARLVLYFSLANIGLAAFNLIPIPPLDGSVLFERALPARYWPRYLRIRPYTMYIVLGLVLLNVYISQNGTGPLNWAFNELYTWWLGVLGVR